MRLSVLDSLRGIFALMIVFLHTAMQSHFYYMDFVRNSDTFVEFFFVLSGFVISLSYMGKVGQRHALPEFIIRRVGRLWPLHMAVLTGFVLLILIKVLADVLGLFSADASYTGLEITKFIIENIFLVQTFRNETVLWLNFPAWSISAELWSYALFGLICLAPFRAIPWLVALIGIVAFAFLRGWIEPGFGEFLGKGLFRGICFFMVGHLCYLVWLRIRHLTLPWATSVECAVLALIIIKTIYLDVPVVKILMPLTFSLAILVFTFEAGAVSRILLGAPMRTLGERSYSIYMIHIFVMSVLGLFIRLFERLIGVSLYSPNWTGIGIPMLLDLGSPWIMDIATLMLVAVVVWLAGFTYRYIEMPGQAWTRVLISRWRVRREAGSLIPRLDGAIFSQEWKEAIWDRFVPGAPRPRSPSEQQYSDLKRRSRR